MEQNKDRKCTENDHFFDRGIIVCNCGEMRGQQFGWNPLPQTEEVQEKSIGMQAETVGLRDRFLKYWYKKSQYTEQKYLTADSIGIVLELIRSERLLAQSELYEAILAIFKEKGLHND